MHRFSFDIETVPDVELGRRLYGLDGLPEEDVATAMLFKQLQATGSEFLPLHQQRIVAISVALRTRDAFRVWSLGDESSNEAELVTRFFDGIDRYTPELVSWNGKGFDLPVLHYRAMKHRVQAPRYWETGDGDREFRYNNYLNRFHWRHVDLMDVLSGFQSRGRARLDEIALMLGLPGKLGMSGDRVWDSFRAGKIREIRNYCETDVLNTWLIFLNFELMRGAMTLDALDREVALVRESLAAMRQPHIDQFLAAWAAAQTPVGAGTS